MADDMLEFPALTTGDVNDDDAAIFDDYTADDSHQGLEPNERPTELYRPPTAQPEPVDQVRAATMSIASTWAPWQAQPRDEGRVKLIIELHPQVLADHIRFASTRGDTLFPMTSAILGNGTYDFGPYTGAVWIYGPDLTDTCVVSVISITK